MPAGNHHHRERYGAGEPPDSPAPRHHVLTIGVPAGGCRRGVPQGHEQKGGFGRTLEARLISLARPAFTSCRLFGSVTPEPVVRSIVRL